MNISNFIINDSVVSATQSLEYDILILEYFSHVRSAYLNMFITILCLSLFGMIWNMYRYKIEGLLAKITVNYEWWYYKVLDYVFYANILVCLSVLFGVIRPV